MLSFKTADLLFFDFDGLLVNTEHLHFQAYQHLVTTHHLSFPWTFSEFAGIAHQKANGVREAMTRQFPSLIDQIGWEALYAEKQRYYAQLLSSKELDFMPGAAAVLTLVQQLNIPHAVVTNSPLDQIAAIRSRLRLLQTIPLWVTRENYPLPKPAPDGYLKAIDLLGGARQTMVGFEDSLRGIHSLQNAGITPILICANDHPQLQTIKPGSLTYFPSFTALLDTV